MARRTPKLSIEDYDPTREQFNAMVQGVYESLVRRELNKPYSTPFRDRRGQRLDVKHFLDPERQRELLSQAYAIATRQGQKHGFLAPGTQTATQRGRSRAKERITDRKALAANVRDFEETLSMVRKGHSRRVVKKGRLYWVQPDNRKFTRLQDAKAYITRQERQEGDLPPRENPDHWGGRDIGRFVREEKRRSKEKGKGSFREWSRHRDKKRAGGRIPPAKGYGTGDFPTKAYIVEVKLYPPQFVDENSNDPQEMYRLAPIASYYTVVVQAKASSFFRFKSVPRHIKRKSRMVSRPIFPPEIWTSPPWAGRMSRNLAMEDLYDIDTKEGPKRWVAGRRIGGGRYGDAPIYMEFNVAGANLPENAQGFNVEAMALAEKAIWEAESVWYEREQQRGDGRVYDYLQPAYPRLKCKDTTTSLPVNSPLVHLGTLARALKALEMLTKHPKFYDAKTNRTFIDMSEVFKNGVFKQLIKPLNQYIVDNGLGEPLEFAGQDAPAKVKGVRRTEPKRIAQKDKVQMLELVPYAQTEFPQTRTISMGFDAYGKEKIKVGEKTLTTRQKTHGLQKGERATVQVGGVPVTVEALGHLTFREAVAEVGGVSSYLRQEGILGKGGFVEMSSGEREKILPGRIGQKDLEDLANWDKLNMPKYGKDWIKGKGKMYLFRLTPNEAPLKRGK